MKDNIVAKLPIFNGDESSGSIHLVKGGRLAYLWVGDQTCIGYTRGSAIDLRRFAEAILAELDKKRRLR